MDNPLGAKAFWKSKVFWLNLLAFLIAAAAILQSSPMFASYGEWFSIVVAILNLALRFGTDTPLKLK